MSEDNYIPYGPEWEKEMNKLPKKFLINMIRKNKEESAKLKEASDVLLMMQAQFNDDKDTIEQFKKELAAVRQEAKEYLQFIKDFRNNLDPNGLGQNVLTVIINKHKTT